MNKFKCQKCRRELFDGKLVLTNHSEPWTESESSRCSAGHTVWYLKDEVLETWLQAQLDAGGWIKGKLHCPHCRLRLGSYDFVGGSKCDCGRHVLPPIHIVKSRVDHENPTLLKQRLEQFSGTRVVEDGDDDADDGDKSRSESLATAGLTLVTEAEISTPASSMAAAVDMLSTDILVQR